MIHVDLSANNFSLSEVEIMAEGLNCNHSILGIHLLGNPAKIDT